MVKLQSNYLEKGVEDFEDLFLYEDRLTGGVWQQLDTAIFQHGHEDVHGSHERLTLFWFLISVSGNSRLVPLHLLQEEVKKKKNGAPTYS